MASESTLLVSRYVIRARIGRTHILLATSGSKAGIYKCVIEPKILGFNVS